MPPKIPENSTISGGHQKVRRDGESPVRKLELPGNKKINGEENKGGVGLTQSVNDSMIRPVRFLEFSGVRKRSARTEELNTGKDSRAESEETGTEFVLKANWQNPETQSEQEIKINFAESLAEQKVFYKDKLNLEINKAEAKAIWEKNYAKIKEEIEKYGYDTILIVPDNLPKEEVLNRDLIESMKETVRGRKEEVAATYEGDNFQNGGSFAGVSNSEQPKYRIILTHSEQNIYNNPAANPYLIATLGKDIMELTGLDSAEVEERITGNQEMTVDFKAIIKGQEVWIQSEGGSLGEYMLQQAMYFKKTGKHLDEDGWTWLLKSRSGSRVVGAGWRPGVRRLGVGAGEASYRGGGLGLRLSRSFSS